VSDEDVNATDPLRSVAHWKTEALRVLRDALHGRWQDHDDDLSDPADIFEEMLQALLPLDDKDNCRAVGG
jgi:hypothetical protein